MNLKTLVFTRSVILVKLLHSSKFKFAHLEDCDNTITVQLLEKLSELTVSA